MPGITIVNRVVFRKSFTSCHPAQRLRSRAVSAAADLVGAERVETDKQPIMGAEDFAFMLKEKPGCYILIGTGDGEGSCHVHNPNYDFNDAAIPFGVGYWVKLVESYLPAS